jgi:hypothetical protein
MPVRPPATSGPTDSPPRRRVEPTARPVLRGSLRRAANSVTAAPSGQQNAREPCRIALSDSANTKAIGQLREHPATMPTASLAGTARLQTEMWKAESGGLLLSKGWQRNVQQCSCGLAVDFPHCAAALDVGLRGGARKCAVSCAALGPRPSSLGGRHGACRGGLPGGIPGRRAVHPLPGQVPAGITTRAANARCASIARGA